MAEVKINNISELESYGNNIKNFSDKYEEETNALYRNFTDKAGSDSKGEAIKAYFEKLNNIQSQVFSELPSAIKKYGEVVTTYVSEIRATEFVDKCYSSDTGANDLSSLLKGTQINDIFNLSKDLDGAFQQAADAMGNPPHNTEGGLNTATTDLENAATKRIEKDKAVQDAYNKFTKNLEDETAAIKSFQDILNNAIYFSDISSSTIFEAIANGELTAEQMFYLDVLKSKKDNQILLTMLGDTPGDVLKIDPETISYDMYTVIADIQNHWTTREDLKKWQHFISALGDYSVERNQTFENYILEAEDKLGEMKIAQMTSWYMQKPEKPENATPEEMEEYNNALEIYQNMLNAHQLQLSSINRSISLLSSLQVLGVGNWKKVEVHPNSQSAETHLYRKIATIEESNGQFIIKTETGVRTSPISVQMSMSEYEKERNFDFKNTDYKWGGDYKEYISTTEFTNFGMQASEYSEHLNNLIAERKAAKEKFSLTLLGSISETVISFLPFGSTAASVIKTAHSALEDSDINGVQSNMTKTIKSGRDEFKKYYKRTTGESLPDSKFDKAWGHWGKLSSGASDIFKGFMDYQSKINEIDDETHEAKKTMMNNILDHGGWSLSEKGNGTIANGRSGQYYDFNAALRANDLNTTGLTGYIDSPKNKFTQKDLDNSIENSFTEKQKEDYANVIAYARGGEKDSGLTLESMTADQLEKFNSIVSNLGGDSWSQMKFYFEDKFSMEEVHN